MGAVLLQLSWGPLLYEVSRVDEKGLQQCNSVAAKIKAQLEKGQFADAEASWSELENVVSATSNSVVRTSHAISIPSLVAPCCLLLLMTLTATSTMQNFYNFLKDEMSGDASASAAVSTLASFRRRSGYSGYLKSMAAAASSSSGSIDSVMNTVIKKKLGIIPNFLKYVRRAMLGLLVKKKLIKLLRLIVRVRWMIDHRRRMIYHTNTTIQEKETKLLGMTMYIKCVCAFTAVGATRQTTCSRPWRETS